eukprot:TRINITY_DN7356_c0_g1_i8.p1 TRINITY_DN7356_c0_g1~~TRINITY_DN7356_c0_g1_i8.p1  ORF type:complete len:474 (+),score=121.06 TRINITY_DN7356_c0_g1_i8:45-1466(+)
MRQIFLLLLPFILASFPKDFKFGVSTAAFQIEGAWLDDDKGLSQWDNLAHLPNYTKDGRAPDIAADSYHLYPEDIRLMHNAGIKHYRMSISWPRIVPEGRKGSEINTKAIDVYRNMFIQLKNAGITPYVTLYHWDFPATLFLQGYYLADKYLVDNFLYYANASFFYFGDLVKNWYTFNEPWCMSVLNDFNERDSDLKPYNYTHNVLLAHAKTVELFRKEYNKDKKGSISIVINTDMYYPKNASNQTDKEAAERALDFQLGWFGDPIFLGHYPARMKQRLKNRLPEFTPEQAQLLKDSSDTFALNHYTSYLCTDPKTPAQKGYYRDRNVETSKHENWGITDMGWPIVPEGIHDLITHISQRYNLKEKKIPIMITENGMANKEPSEKEALNDQPRIDYLKSYLGQVEKAVDEGMNVQGYFLWSLLDNFEWREGFTKRFGIVRVEFTDTPTRTEKASYYWYADYIRSKTKQDLSSE